MWNRINKSEENMPPYDIAVLCVIQHWNTLGIRYAILKRVMEDDCTWRTTDDNSELSYDWSVILWQHIPLLPKNLY